MGGRVDRRRFQSLAGGMMTTRTQDATLVTVVILVGLAMIFDLHRTFLAWAWPIVTAYTDWLFS
jgi:hypothetical protein